MPQDFHPSDASDWLLRAEFTFVTNSTQETNVPQIFELNFYQA